MPFDYPSPKQRYRHLPRGYRNYQEFKPWLRDEFQFRCAYCLVRETWYFRRGEVEFQVDHIHPKSRHPEIISEYENLIYCCKFCNWYKGDQVGLPSPIQVANSDFLRVRPDGVIIGVKDRGNHLIEALLLNEEELVDKRREMIEQYDRLSKSRAPRDKAKLRQRFGFPKSLPDLSRLRPPGGNLRPEGIAESFQARLQRGTLEETYC
jgi:HNH endonuclease